MKSIYKNNSSSFCSKSKKNLFSARNPGHATDEFDRTNIGKIGKSEWYPEKAEYEMITTMRIMRVEKINPIPKQGLLGLLFEEKITQDTMTNC